MIIVSFSSSWYALSLCMFEAILIFSLKNGHLEKTKDYSPWFFIIMSLYLRNSVLSVYIVILRATQNMFYW